MERGRKNEPLPLGEKLEPKSPVRVAEEDDSNSNNAIGAVEAREGEGREGKRSESGTTRTRRFTSRGVEDGREHSQADVSTVDTLCRRDPGHDLKIGRRERK